uniref:Uncharacterized protein n=1 Tax=Tanacetum cinerariifolium TaxID=118510 RepID=A0A6L2KC10_TANCI|nr:hypothetical protein [Tanacetum cinerariifolium]
MADLAFAPQHNMVSYLEKTEGNAEFHQIVDFLASSSIYHALIIHAIADGKGSDSGPGCQETIGGTLAQIRPEGAPIQSSDLPLSTCNTVGKKVKTAQAKEIDSLKKRVTKLEQRQGLRILGFHPFKDGMNFVLDEDADKTEEFNLDVDIEVIVEDKGGVKKGGSTAETVSIARPYISAARLEVSTAEPKTPPTKTNLFDDEDVTIADTLTKKRDQDQIERDVEVALKIQADLDEEVRTEKERQEEASKAALAELYDEVQVHIDADHELAARLTHEEQEKYTVEERFTHAQLKSRSFKEIQKLYTKEQKRVDAFVPIGFEEDEKRVGSRKKRAANSSSKKKSSKKQKVNDQEFVDSDKELRKCLKVVPDDDKAINYETLDFKIPIVDCESQVLGTMEAGDVHVYKLTRLNGSYRHFSTFSRMIEVLKRRDVLDLHKIVMERFPANDPEGYDLILWGDLKTLMESSEDDEIWRNQQDWKLLS